jgi:hypothetical protein
MIFCEDVELQSELRHALTNMEMLKCPLSSIMAYVEVGESRIFKSTLVSRLIGNPTLSKDQSVH